MNPALPLAVLGLVDAAFSGYRAYAGRDARIRRQRAVVRAALRGLAVGSVLLLVPALTAGAVLLFAEDPDRAYEALADGGTGFLVPIWAYTLAVGISFASYFALPYRAGTLAMAFGLGPLTLARPLFVAGACAGALVGGGWTSLLVGAVAGAAALCVEPYVHRRWYAFPV
ncbi:hypothetical protein OG730_28125 [Streptomyces sp. NBC_01298]|uniref:hypothetical protein n=1 Tax=Streptomyces sp. NBC_01298 TaxID=2903817 RepID=UPI002E0D45AE|nr:hypothetical protein OG730_28125 [Streptomyces sp. NBC_01298]